MKASAVLALAPLTALVTLLALGFTTPGAAATRYWAFGDSITRAEGLGYVLEDAFLVPDQDCLTNPYPVLKCGYHWRLRDQLTLAGVAVEDVFNRGVAGESTLGGTTRIEQAGEPLFLSRCTDSDAGDVVLVMEGTNDINGVIVDGMGPSTDTIRDQLAMIVDKATGKCVHSVLASTIRRLLPWDPLLTYLGDKTGDPLEPMTSDLATKISMLASDKNRAYVNVWGSLCPTQNCYNLRYWGRIVFNDPGHVNYSGFELMAPLFKNAILATPLPGAATLTGPTGDGTDTTPPFTWNEHAHSDWYYLEVDGGSSYGQWHPEKHPEEDPREDICTGGVCTFDPGVTLAPGAHTWRVRTRNLRGVGSWSSAMAFSVWTALPGAVTLTAPAGDGCQAGAGPYTVTYLWNEATQGKDYRLQVTNATTAAIVLDATYPASTVCGGGTCSVTPATKLPPGAYTWKVRGINPVGNGPWSASTAFARFPSTLTAPVPTYPLDDIFDGTSSFPPTYRWSAAAGTEDYDLTLDASTTTHAATTVCTSSGCEVTGGALTVAAHTWQVTAKNRCNPGTSTGSNAFAVLICTMPKDENLPTSGPIAGAVDEAACGELRALAGYVVGATGIVTFHAGEAVVLGNGFQVSSGGAFEARADH